MSKKISQREARRLRRELKALQDRHLAMHRRYVSNYPGVHIRTSIPISETTREVLNVAVLLGHGLAARVNGNTLDIYAVKS